MTQAVADFIDELVQMAEGISLDTVPAAVVHEGRRHLLDTIGCILAGMGEPEPQALAAQMAAASVAPGSTILGTGLRADAMWAALANGTAGVWHDLDSGNRFLGGHPAVHAIPAALAVAERLGSSGAHLLAATIAGYEVSARVALGTRLRPGMHPHGSWPVVGAAVAAALLHGTRGEALREVINVSTSLTLATSFKTTYEGATVRNVYAGFGAAMGVYAADLVQDGFTGERDGIATVFGRIAGTGFDPERARSADFQILRGYEKLHACCRYVHPALDALVALTGRTPVDAAQVAQVTVHTYDIAARMTDVAPGNALAAKFSMPHAMASYLVLRETGIDAFSDEACRHPGIRALAQRVTVHEDADMNARTPAERPATVRLHLTNGQVLEESVHLPLGEFDSEPSSDAQLSSKFRTLVTPVLGASATERLLDMLWQVEQVSDVRRLTALAGGGAR